MNSPPQNLAELREQIAEGLKQADRGEFFDGEEVFQELEDLPDSAPCDS